MSNLFLHIERIHSGFRLQGVDLRFFQISRNLSATGYSGFIRFTSATLLFLGALVVASRLLNIKISGQYELITYACDLVMVQQFPFVDSSHLELPGVDG